MNRFVHLHVHSEYSLLDGSMPVSRILDRVHELGMDAVALTDHGNMCGAIDFYRQARRRAVKAIVGMEAYMAEKDRTNMSAVRTGEDADHLTLLAANDLGYRNLMCISSLAHETGFRYKPRMDWDLLGKHHEGLVALSGCLKGRVPQLLREGHEEEADVWALRFRDTMGEGNFFIEIQDQDMPEQRRLNPALVALSRRTGIPLVATNDVHYLNRDDAEIHEVLLCLQTQTTMDNPDRMRLPTPEFYLKPPEEMAELFKDLPGALENTAKIAERCSLELRFADDPGGQPIFPQFEVPAPFTTADEYLRHLCDEGAVRRYGHVSQRITERMEHELRVIRELHFSPYFLILWDIIRFSRSEGIMVGPGRGSSAGSLVAFLLGITGVDPLKYNLFFERFLNAGRHEPPDIDVDFRDDRRGEVVEYVKKKYGAENVAQIGTLSRMHARAAVRDVGRAMGFTYGEVDRIAKLVPNVPGVDLDKAKESAEFRSVLAEKEGYQKLYSIARSVEGLARHASTHAAGVVIVPGGLRSHVPLLRISDGVFVTQYDMNDLKNLGLVKMDLLGLATLTVLDECRILVKQTRGVEVDYLGLSLDDKAAFALFSEGKTDGIFQFESHGMKDNLRKLKPDRLENLIAMNALYRPGPMDQIELYIRRHRGEKFVYDPPELEPILKGTYGIIVYQEQVQQVAHVIGGFSMEKADDFRRSMGKKIAEIMEEQRTPFVKGAEKNGIPTEKAAEIFEFLEKFAGYGFNRSHSTAYALLAYWTAYMKAHYPVEFMAALLTSEMGSQDKVAEYVSECRKMGVKILPPDISKSMASFSVEGTPGKGNGSGQAVRFGLAAVKNVGESAVGAIVKARESGGPFKSLDDFCERVETASANKKVMESLIKCGAFDGAGGKREQLLTILDTAIARGSRRQDERKRGQSDLFGEAEKAFTEPLPDVEETPERTRLSYEKELLGCYISGHPLAEFEEEAREFASHTLQPETVGALPHQAPLRVAGVVTSVRMSVTREKKPFARFQVEDLEGSIDCVAWPEAYTKCGSCLTVGTLILVSGALERPSEGRPTMVARDMMRLEEAPARMTRTVHLLVGAVGADEAMLRSVQKVASMSPGEAALVIHLASLHHGEVLLEAHPSMNIKPTRELVAQLRALLGEDNVRLSTARGFELDPPNPSTRPRSVGSLRAT